MTKAIVTLAITTAMSCGLWAQQKGDFEIDKVQPAIVKTPEYQYSGADQKRSKPGQWLEVEVEFTARPEITDELTAKYYIKFAGQCLTGEVTHVNVLAGRELHSVMYVAPGTLTRLLGRHPLTGGSIEDVGVQLWSKGKLVATKSFKAAGDSRWWETVQQIPGLVLNKNETPFAPLYWDRYEAIQSRSR